MLRSLFDGKISQWERAAMDNCAAAKGLEPIRGPLAAQVVNVPTEIHGRFTDIQNQLDSLKSSYVIPTIGF